MEGLDSCVFLQKDRCAFVFGVLKKRMGIYYYDKAVTVAVQRHLKSL